MSLPSELEWERAARGALPDAVFSWGDEPDPERANYDDSRIGDTSPVGCFAPNGFGLHDMIGNLWEWTRSPYDEDVRKAVREESRASEEGRRVVRGGSWFGSRGSARCACSFRAPPYDRSGALGFRVVLRSSPVS